MAAALRELPGNPSSPHGPGRAARAAVERARAEVAALIGATAGGDCLHLGGDRGERPGDRWPLARGAGGARAAAAGCTSVSSPIEHPSVLGALAADEVELTLLAGRRRRHDRSSGAARGDPSGHRAGDAGARQSRARERLRSGGAGGDRARKRRAVSRRRRSGGRQDPRRRRRAGRRRADDLGAQDPWAQGFRRDLPAPGSAVRAGRTRRPSGAGAPRRHRERRWDRRLRRGGPSGAGRARRQKGPGSRRCATGWRRGSSRSRNRGATAIRRARCQGRSTSALPARQASWWRRRSISRRWPSRPARPAPRDRWSPRRCCWRWDCRSEEAASALRFGLGRGTTSEEIDRAARSRRRDRRPRSPARPRRPPCRDRRRA